MKKIFQIIGLISLTCFSFFMTEKTANVVNNMDEIMIQIKENKDKYTCKAINAEIDENKIIPGINGRTVNIKKSYKNMKQNGYYSDRLYIYDYKKPKISISDNIDKYIIKGNPEKRMVSLAFKVKPNDNVNDILSIVNNYNIKVDFFIDPVWFDQNDDVVQNIIKYEHSIGILLDNYSYSDYQWLDVVIKKVNNQKNNFCYTEAENSSILDYCILQNNYTVKFVSMSPITPLKDVKKNLSSGGLYSFTINSELKKELSSIIIAIKSKGLKIANLEEHIIE